MIMKNFLPIALVFILVLCGCSARRNEEAANVQPSTETSIVYIYVTPDGETMYEQPAESANEDATPVTTTVSTTVEETTNNDAEIISTALQSAEESLAARDYDGALSIIAEANRNVSNNSELLVEQERINSLRPVALTDLNMLAGNPDIYRIDEINTGESVFCMGETAWDIDAHETQRNRVGLTYANYGEYDTFSCRLALMNDSSRNTYLNCFIEVYCDDILVYTSPSVTAGSLPVDINVDISNSDSVEIKFCVTNPTDNNWLGSMVVWDYYPVSWSIVDAEFTPAYVPLDN